MKRCLVSIMWVISSALVCPGASSSQPVAAAIDTVVLRIAVPDTASQPVAVYIVPDSVAFGGLLQVVADYGDVQVGLDEMSVAAAGEEWIQAQAPAVHWWERFKGGRTPAGDVLVARGLPEPAGLRVVRSYPVYSLGVLRGVWRDQDLGSVVVTGRGSGATGEAAIRDPRALRWRPWSAVSIGLAFLLLLAGGYWWWRHRSQPDYWVDWSISEPIWMEAACQLQDLVAADGVALGETRSFLDQLAAVVRLYTAGRYHIPAREMTGSEILNACVALGHQPVQPRGLARLMDLLDETRYDPAEPTAGFCRAQAESFYRAMDQTRVVSVVPVTTADRCLAADRAWAKLTASFGSSAARVGEAT